VGVGRGPPARLKTCSSDRGAVLWRRFLTGASPAGSCREILPEARRCPAPRCPAVVGFQLGTDVPFNPGPRPAPGSTQLKNPPPKTHPRGAHQGSSTLRHRPYSLIPSWSRRVKHPHTDRQFLSGEDSAHMRSRGPDTFTPPFALGARVLISTSGPGLVPLGGGLWWGAGDGPEPTCWGNGVADAPAADRLSTSSQSSRAGAAPDDRPPRWTLAGTPGKQKSDGSARRTGRCLASLAGRPGPRSFVFEGRTRPWLVDAPAGSAYRQKKLAAPCIV